MLVLCTGVGTVSAYNYLKGTWDNWTAHQFSNLEDGIETVSISLAAATNYTFEVRAGGGDGTRWKASSTMTLGNSESWVFDTNSGDGTTLTTSIAGEYTFRLKWINNAANVTVIYPSSEEIVVHFENHGSWAAVNGYRYNNSYGKETDWPGPVLSSNSLDPNYYDFVVTKNNDDFYNNFIFSNNGSDTEKTASLEIDYNSPEYWVYYNGSAYSVSTTPPASFTYTRSGLSVGKFGTICMPYAIASVTGAKLWVFTGMT